jgi:hypothetical protein
VFHLKRDLSTRSAVDSVAILGNRDSRRLGFAGEALRPVDTNESDSAHFRWT